VAESPRPAAQHAQGLNPGSGAAASSSAAGALSVATAGPDTLIHGADSTFDASAFEQSMVRPEPRRWIGWRLRLLVLAALAGCLAVFAVMQMLATSARLDATFQTDEQGQLALVSGGPQALAGHALARIEARGEPMVSLDGLLLRHSARWMVDDVQRSRWLRDQDRLTRLLAHGQVQLHFTDGSLWPATATARGHGGLGLPFWPLTAFALLLYLIGVTVLLQQPNLRNGLYAVMAWCQAGNLLLIAAATTPGLGLPAGLPAADLLLREALDVGTAAAAVAAYALHPVRVPQARSWALAAAAVALGWLALVLVDALPHRWLFTQGVVVGLGSAACAVIAWSNRLVPNSFTAVMRRFTFLAVGTFALLTAMIALTHRLGGATSDLAAVATLVWYLFFASLLLLVPFLTRSRQLLREFALLAGIGTVATSLALIFVAGFSLGPLAALSLAVGLALAIYLVSRQWLLTRMMGASVLTTERTFEQLYRVARVVQETPSLAAPQLSALLQELFAPLEMQTLPRRLPAARVVAAGSALYVPLPGDAGLSQLNQVLVMRHASQGKRLFTQDDAHLAERVVDQVCRAVAYDLAVEQGRSEERQRLAQDLHDDIGARLLTLMYKSTDREMEDYIRHTLQDLKTLTRGLAASNHRLSHAAGEWKADLSQRLSAARLRFGWTYQADVDITLTVVQWSALTRILRELVSNALYHAKASRVDVTLQLEAGVIRLRVADDGTGGDPQAWSHGLGLGGVRKRVRALGGSVHWQAGEGGGIVCQVTLPQMGERTVPPVTQPLN
jgi:signal transduction histidine kinase